jgi:hypothetical protein
MMICNSIAADNSSLTKLGLPVLADAEEEFDRLAG